MTDEEMLRRLLEIGKDMRAAQKGFFAAKDQKTKRDYLVKSKQHEKEFDNALFNIGQLLK